MLWNLHVNLRTRVTLMLILGIGVFACVAASIKVSYLTNYGKTNDLLWDSRNITIWTAAELNVASIAASLPCLKPIFKRILEDKYGLGTRETNRKQDLGMGRNHLEAWRGRKSKYDASESQIALEERDCQYLANDHSTNYTEISSGARPDSKDDVSPTVIFATTSTKIQFSDRTPRD